MRGGCVEEAPIFGGACTTMSSASSGEESRNITTPGHSTWGSHVGDGRGQGGVVCFMNVCYMRPFELCAARACCKFSNEEL